MNIFLREPLDPADPAVEQFLTTIQANILNGHGRRHAHHLMINFGGASVADARALLAEEARAGRLTSAFEQMMQGRRKKLGGLGDEMLQTFSLTRLGYRFLQLEVPADRAFRDGVHERFSDLRDPSPTTWEASYASADSVHAMLLIACDDDAALTAAVAHATAQLTAIGAAVVCDEIGNQLIDANNKFIEHFGYRDGISQPNFFRKSSADTNKDFDQHTRVGLVLDEDPNAPDSFGSYLVFRKLEQDVNGFNAAVARIAARRGIAEELAGAMAVGRFKDGTPIVKHSIPQGALGDQVDFNYDHDKGGARCPMHAHVRKVNPRNEIGFFKNILAQEQRRRIARRGITYSDAAGGAAVGLLFMCYQSNIAEQFEFIQRRWANGPDFLKGGTGRDPIIGQISKPEDAKDFPEWSNAWGDESDKERVQFGQYVRMRGGAYFFTPSVVGLQRLV